MLPFWDRALLGRGVSLDRVCIPRSQYSPLPGPRPAVPARRGAARSAGGSGQPEARPRGATGPSSSLITQEHAWKMGGEGEGRCGEGNSERGATRGAGTLVRRTAFCWGCAQISVCARAARGRVPRTRSGQEMRAHSSLARNPGPRRSADVARAVPSFGARVPLLPLVTIGALSSGGGNVKLVN